MITVQEVSALAQLLNRLPITQAEGLWLQGFMEKLKVMAQLQAQMPGRPGTGAGAGREPPEQGEGEDAS